jgi:hypothetical protein
MAIEDFKIDGLNDIMDLINILPDKVQNQILKSVERKVLQEEVVKPLRSAVPYRAETKKKISVYPDDKDRLTMWAGPSLKVFWLRFVELGTKVRTTKSGANRGAIQATNRIPTAMDSATQGVLDRFSKDFGEEVNRVIEKKIKKINK